MNETTNAEPHLETPTMTTTQTRTPIHFLRQKTNLFAWTTDDFIDWLQDNPGVSIADKMKIIDYIEHLPQDQEAGLRAIIKQATADQSHAERTLSQQASVKLASDLADILNCRREAPRLEPYPDQAANRAVLDKPLYAWTLRDVFETAREQNFQFDEQQVDDMENFILETNQQDQPALIRYLADAVAEHREELAAANRRLADTMLHYLNVAARNGSVPPAHR